jgi:hypothetical protein
MEPPQDALAGKGLVILNKAQGKTRRVKIPFGVGLKKIAPGIAKYPRFNDIEAFYGEWSNGDGHSLLLRHKAQVCAVIGFKAIGDGKELVPADPAVAVGYFFDTSDIESLPFLDGFYKVRGFQKAVVAAGIEPGHTAAQELYVELAPGEVFVINGGYFDFSPTRGLYVFCDIDYLVIIKIEAWNRIMGLGFCGFFFYAKNFALGI